MRWLAKEIANITSNTEEDVFDLLENEEYIDSLIDKYWFITDEIKDEDIYYPLEGYLFPDTYAIENKDVKYQVTADNTSIYVGNDKEIDLGNKKIIVNLIEGLI